MSYEFVNSFDILGVNGSQNTVSTPKPNPMGNTNPRSWGLGGKDATRSSSPVSIEKSERIFSQKQSTSCGTKPFGRTNGT
jgi:hypothetical protein